MNHGFSPARRYVAEALGTAMLLCIVVGSGIMAERLSGALNTPPVAGSIALALLANAIATGCGLYAIICVFGPISGAHFNPVVSAVAWQQKQLSGRDAFNYGLFQTIGGIAGVWLTHLMFALPVLQFSTHQRNSSAEMLSDVVATFGLILVIFQGSKTAAKAVPAMVATYITAAYWFTASTSFANPAVTIARAFSNTFAGIAPADIVGFIVAQCVGAGLALVLVRWFNATDKR
jgi:glycerol uptake facilitator-like aquaporin